LVLGRFSASEDSAELDSSFTMRSLGVHRDLRN